MLITDSVLSNRATSSFGISIGTALALETLFTGTEPVYDPERIIPDRIDIKNYDEFWINISTLHRNIMGSVGTEDQKRLFPADILTALEYETELIKELVNKNSYGKTKVIFYYSHYRDLAVNHPHAKLRSATTEKQKEYAHTETLVMKEYLRRHKKDNEILELNRKLTPTTQSSALLISHYAYDLLSASKFKQLHLLESHTGVLKKSDAFYTKFSNGKELMRIPLNICMLQLFGDSQHFFPFPKEARTAVIEIANERQWTSVTTPSRIAYCVSLLRDKYLAEVLTSMLKESI